MCSLVSGPTAGHRMHRLGITTRPVAGCGVLSPWDGVGETASTPGDRRRSAGRLAAPLALPARAFPARQGEAAVEAGSADHDWPSGADAALRCALRRSTSLGGAGV